MSSLILITDTSDISIQSLDIGAIGSSTYSFSIRAWNNMSNVPGIERVVGVKLELLFPPEEAINIIVGSGAIQGRCTYSGKTGDTISESFKEFPIESELYDVLYSNSYNEYEIQIDTTKLTSEQLSAVEDVLSKFNLTLTWASTTTDRFRWKVLPSSVVVKSTKELSIGSYTTVV